LEQRKKKKKSSNKNKKKEVCALAGIYKGQANGL
jgi:hypothetical protein